MPPKRRSKTGSPDQSGPWVIVDFIFDRGVLSISVKNIGAQPAFCVRIRFSHKLMGMAGTVDMSALPLFHALEFLPAGKDITTILDTSASYFRGEQPTQITATITYQDAAQRHLSNQITHNLEIYRGISFVCTPSQA